MGVAGISYELHPHNFQNQYNFLRSWNVITMIFWYFCSILIFKNSQWAIRPCTSVVLGLNRQNSIPKLFICNQLGIYLESHYYSFKESQNVSKDFKKFWLSASRKIEYFIDETKLFIIVKIVSSIAAMLFSNFKTFGDGLIKKIYS